MSEETNQTEREYTQQEILEMQQKTIGYYRSQELVLIAQCTVEELKARIKKAQFEAFEYTLKMMQLNEAIREAEEEEENEEPQKEE